MDGPQCSKLVAGVHKWTIFKKEKLNSKDHLEKRHRHSLTRGETEQMTCEYRDTNVDNALWKSMLGITVLLRIPNAGSINEYE